MRDKFNKFMQGRYGVDDLSRFTMGVALVLIILANVVKYIQQNCRQHPYTWSRSIYMHIQLFFPEISSSVMP